MGTLRMGTLRLTRRGRVALVLLVMVLSVVAGLTIGRATSQAADPQRNHAAAVTVEAGDTLWSVASRIAPHVDPRVVIGDIEQLNHLTSPTVLPGERLLVPRYR
ncbi:MAG TPA: LysM peptidoglycan-binding domain-containing protein [Mycobacteriales bacterium]|jgi:hypothetical protein|nr:LysM peptidoglycan-binding domain-containing protein [Mycobacteriales bacterium]